LFRCKFYQGKIDRAHFPRLSWTPRRRGLQIEARGAEGRVVAVAAVRRGIVEAIVTSLHRFCPSTHEMAICDWDKLDDDSHVPAIIMLFALLSGQGPSLQHTMGWNDRRTRTYHSSREIRVCAMTWTNATVRRRRHTRRRKKRPIARR
jgi:hypothetical protein